MKKYIPLTISILTVALLLGFESNQGRARQGNSDSGRMANPSEPMARSSYIPVQGRMTDENGTPLDGNYDITFRLYDTRILGTALCEFMQPGVPVKNGLFNAYMDMGGCAYIDGRQLYLGLQVGSDPEMSPRQFIDNVPYAWTLRPGAEISATIGNDAALDIDNYSDSGRGLRAEAQAATGTTYAVLGAAKSIDGFGGYFYNNGGGVGLRAESDSGAAIKATGSGIIQSSALSYLWISGSGVRPYRQSDSTIIDMDTVGGAKIYRGATSGDKNVMLPISITGPLYGQEVRVTGLDLYYVGDTGSDFVSVVLMRRQTGVCATAPCYVELVRDGTDLTCDDSIYPTGCSYHYDITSDNVLTADSGVIYLTLQLAFSSGTSWVEIGGVRLTLAHN